MRYLITISYDGSKYYGFQRLNEKNTVQKEIESALTIINKEQVVIKGSGRTDRNVHAIAQKCHFDLNYEIPPSRLKNALNSLLSDSIVVKDCIIVNKNFHARFDVKMKIYKYIINLGEYSAIKNDYIYNYCKKLNKNKMKKAIKLLKGKHSYKSFVSGERNNYNSEIYKTNIKSKDDYLIITLIGKSFYRYMVRNIVGALISVGNGKITIKDFANLIDNENNKIIFMTVPANGLYLVDVKY